MASPSRCMTFRLVPDVASPLQTIASRPGRDGDRGAQGATGDPAGTAHVAARAPTGFQIYCGDDDDLPLLAVGAIGASASPRTGWARSRGGDQGVSRRRPGGGDRRRRPAARRLDFESSEDSRTLTRQGDVPRLGLRVGQCRLPMGSATRTRRPAAEILAAFGPPIDRANRLPERSGLKLQGQARPRRLPRRAGRDRSQLRLHRGRRPHHRPRLRDHVP